MKRLFFAALLGLIFYGCEIGAIKRNYEITVYPNDWRAAGVFGQPGYYMEASFVADYLTGDVLRRGAVLVYADFSDESVQLPHVISRQVHNSRFVETLGYVLSPGRITFTLDDSDFQTDPYSTPVIFRIVVIR